MNAGEGRSPKRPDRRWLLVAVGTALALMVLIIVTTADSEPILHQPDRDPDIHVRHGTFQAPTINLGPSGATTVNEQSQKAALTLGHIITDVLLALLLLGVLWLAATIVVSLIRRWRRRERTRRAGRLDTVDDAVLDAVQEATTRQQGLLHEGEPSNAVVACWVDLEQAVAAAGVERRPSETSAELTIRMLDALEVDRRALRTLGGLYREARYSSHPLTEQDRQRALDALRALQRSLPQLREPQV